MHKVDRPQKEEEHDTDYSKMDSVDEANESGEISIPAEEKEHDSKPIKSFFSMGRKDKSEKTHKENQDKKLEDKTEKKRGLPGRCAQRVRDLMPSAPPSIAA